MFYLYLFDHPLFFMRGIILDIQKPSLRHFERNPRLIRACVLLLYFSGWEIVIFCSQQEYYCRLHAYIVHMSNRWERLLSSAPETASWPPGFVKATVPRLSPRLNKKRAIATSSGRLQQPIPTKRRPSVLGGGFSTAVLSSAASCPWGDDSPDPGFGCGEQHDGGARRPSVHGTQCGDQNGDENGFHDDGAATLAEVSVVGRGDRYRRRSSLARELSNRNIVVLGDTITNSQQLHWAKEDESSGCSGSDGRRIAPVRAGALGPNPAAFVDIVSRDTTGR